MNLDFMECPGAIIDAPLPAAMSPPVKAKSNPKHHRECVERAAFPQEERAMAKAKEEAEKASSAKGKLGELEAQKKAAIANEDFLEAQRLKKEIEALQNQERSPPRPAPVSNAPAACEQRARPQPVSNAVQSFSTPSPARGREDVVEAMLATDQVSDFSGEAAHISRPREGRQRPRADAPPSSWNMQVDEPARPAPSVSEDPVRKRFWNRGGANNKPAARAAAPTGGTDDTSMVVAFDSS
jgi:hypothetical protein